MRGEFPETCMAETKLAQKASVERLEGKMQLRKRQKNDKICSNSSLNMECGNVKGMQLVPCKSGKGML